MPRPVYRFGPYRFDPAARELRCDGKPVAATQKVIDTLAWLIAHRDRAVGRDELIAAVWGRIDVSDTHLGKTMFQVRRAVGDSGGDQGRILTVPRFGYRWVAPVTLEPEQESGPTAGEGRMPATPPADAAPVATGIHADRPRYPARHPRAMGRRAAIAAAVLLVLAVALAFAWRRHPPAGSTTAAVLPAGTLAVLPADVQADGEWAWLRLGLMDLVANRLRGAGLVVMPSDNIVALARAAPVAGTLSRETAQAMARLTGTDRLLQVAAQRQDLGWTVRLALHEPGIAPREAQAQDPDVVAAARQASDRLLAQLGRVADPEPGVAPSIEALRQRVEAALLAGTPVAARQWLDTLAPALQQTAEARLQRARVDIAEGRLETARAALDTLLREVSAEADPLLRVRVLFEAGHAAFFQGGAAAPVAYFDEALAVLGDRRLPTLQSAAHAWRGIAYAKAGANAKARGDFAVARVLLQQAGDALGLARLDINEGLLDIADGRHAEALPLLQRAAGTFERFDLPDSLARALTAEARVALAQVRPDRALPVSLRGFALAGRITTPLTRSQLLGTHAAVLAAHGRLAESRQVLAEARDAAAQAGERSLDLVLLAAQADDDLARGDAAAAQAAAAIVVAGLDSPDQAPDRASAWLTLTRALRQLGRPAEAAQAVAAFATWVSTADLPSVRMLGALAQAEQAAADHQAALAADRYEAALQSARQAGAPAGLIAVADAYGRALLAAGDQARAAAVIGQVERWADHDFTAALLQAELQRALGRDAAWRDALRHARLLAGERPLPAMPAGADGASGPGG